MIGKISKRRLIDNTKRSSKKLVMMHLRNSRCSKPSTKHFLRKLNISLSTAELRMRLMKISCTSSKDQLPRLKEKSTMIEIDSSPHRFKNRLSRMISNIDSHNKLKHLPRDHRSLESLSLNNLRELNQHTKSKSLNQLLKKGIWSSLFNKWSNSFNNQSISSQSKWFKLNLNSNMCQLSNLLDMWFPTSNNHHITKVLHPNSNMCLNSNLFNSKCSNHAKWRDLQWDNVNQCTRANLSLTQDQLWRAKNNPWPISTSQTRTVSHQLDSSKRRRTNIRSDKELSLSQEAPSSRRSLSTKERRALHVMREISSTLSQRLDQLEIEAPITRLLLSQDTTRLQRIPVTLRLSPRHLDPLCHQCSRRRNQSVFSRLSLTVVRMFSFWESSKVRFLRKSLKNLVTNSTSVRMPSTSFSAESTNNCNSELLTNALLPKW